MKKIVAICFVSLLFLLAACQNNTDNNQAIDREDANEENGEVKNEAATKENDEEAVEEDIKPLVTIEMEDGQTIEMELYPSIAPNTVNNFISLIEDEFYDGLIFHRVIPNFMVQGGDPEGNGTGGPGYMIPGEFANNGFDNDLLHERGVVSMARSEDPDSAGSQFFIMVEEAEHLDGDYAAFGKVTEGMDVVDEIVSVERDDMDKPLEDIVMKKVTVDLAGYEYTEVEKK